MFDYFPKPNSTFAGDLDGLFKLVTFITGFWFVLAQAAIFYFLIRYRKSAAPKAAYVTGGKPRHLAWVLVPVAIILSLDLYIDVVGARAWEKVTRDLPLNSAVVKVTAKQFNWEMAYAGPDERFGTEDDFIANNELHVQVDRPVRLSLQSKDVIHALFLPTVRLKMDVIPGRERWVWFEPIEAGTFELACAELCGFGHYTMKGKLVVHDAEEFSQWQKSMVPVPEETQ